ncbi:hypothetical protein ACNG34_000479 [Enterococcus faecium]|uniref:hypothetical protein n=1 Tax=Enterococcus lactis TaxID=357441 RepID=UPI00383FC5A5
MITEVAYNDHIKRKINTRLDSKVALINLVIEVSKFMLIKNNMPYCDCGTIYFESLSRRVFFSEPNPKTGEVRHFSFQFPFRITEEDNQIRLTTYKTDISIESTHLQVLQSILNEGAFTENSLKYGISLGLAELIEETLREMNLGTYFIDDINSLILDLLLFEPSYMRFDEHKSGEKGKIHPLYHFDIFYSQFTTLKIGYNSRMSYKNFKELLNREEKECLYLS